MCEEIKCTIALCDQCLKKIPAKIIKQDNNVFLSKTCPEHGTRKTLLSTDYNYYCKEEQTAISTFPFKKVKCAGECPTNCGICSNHNQHAAMAIIEVTDSCNMKCSTCIAASYPGASKHKSLSSIEKMMDVIITQEGEAGVIMISGGEPTIHPKFFEILDMAVSKKFRRIMLITNGILLAENQEFVKKLSQYDTVEVYLQFDSLNSESLKNIRGFDLLGVRKRAVDNLEKFGIYSTLICVAKKNVNLTEINEIIDFARHHKYIVGITIQPIKITGRHDTYKMDEMVTTTEVISEISKNPLFSIHDFEPHPLNPHAISTGYFLKSNMQCVTKDLLSSTDSVSDMLRQRMYFTPDMTNDKFNYQELFRLTIVNFLDKFNFDFELVKNCCIHFVSEDLRVIPFDTYYMFHKELTKII